MRAAQINGYGGEAAVGINEAAERPKPGPGEVLVEVFAAAVNPFDWKVRDGLLGEKLQLPATPGGDVAGRVAELGEGVSGFEVGQPVFGMANAAGGRGSFAEFTPVKASQLAAKPDSLNYEQAAALPLAAVSAYQALVDHINLHAGQKILIHGAAGGIGSFAAQLAKSLGAEIAVTVGQADIDYVKELGADIVINYAEQSFADIVRDVDAVFDTVGGETNRKSYFVIKSGGQLVSMVEPADEALAAEHRISYVHQSSMATPERLAAIAKLADEGALKAHIDKVFSLDEAAAALEYLKSSHPKGKVVIRIKQ